jgi:transcription initiation factor TFIIIB Brf1 subunit/transcription initiation factor TFIIB
MIKKCPECKGELIRDKFDVVCRKCGLVVDYPICLVEPEIFE